MAGGVEIYKPNCQILLSESTAHLSSAEIYNADTHAEVASVPAKQSTDQLEGTESKPFTTKTVCI